MTRKSTVSALYAGLGAWALGGIFGCAVDGVEGRERSGPLPDSAPVAVTYSGHQGSTFVGTCSFLVASRGATRGSEVTEVVEVSLVAEADGGTVVAVNGVLSFEQAEALFQGEAVEGAEVYLQTPESFEDPRTLAPTVDAIRLSLDGATFGLLASGDSFDLSARGQFVIGCSVRSSDGVVMADSRWESELCARAKEQLDLQSWIDASR